MINSNSKVGRGTVTVTLSDWRGWTLKLLFLLFVVSLTFPYVGPLEFFDPMDFWDSDDSWIYAVNYAVSENLVFGRDVVFSYGPLAAFFLPLDFFLHVEIGAILRISLWIFWLLSMGCLKKHFGRNSDFMIFSMLSVLCGMPIGEDVRMVERTGILILSVVNFLLLAHAERRAIWWAFSGAISAIALLVKFNVGVACSGMLIAAYAVFAYQNWHIKAISKFSILSNVLAVFWGTFLFFFLIFGGPLDAVPEFLNFSMQVASGFSSEMSLDKNSALLYAAIFATAAIYGFLFMYLFITRSQSISIMIWSAPAIFLLYKAMIVRQDFVVNFGPNFLVIGAILSAFLVLKGRRNEQIILRSTAFIFVLGGVLLVGLFYPKPEVMRHQLGAAKTLKDIVFQQRPQRLKSNEDLVAMRLDGSQQYFKLNSGAPVDIYPKLAGLSWGFTFKYHPRFALQSYAAYSRELDAMSAAGLNSQTAPEFVLYSHESIDGAHPQAVDPLTWQAIFRWYDPLGLSRELLRGGSLLLERRLSPRIATEPRQLGAVVIQSGSAVEIPEVKGALTVISAQYQMNWLGHLANFFFKVERPAIRVAYSDGTALDYRLSPAAAGTGFLAGSLSRDLMDVARLFTEGPMQQVRQITFYGNAYFHKDIEVSLSAFAVQDGV